MRKKKQQQQRKKATRDYHAMFTVYGASLLGVEKRRDIADWLRSQAKYLIKDGIGYSDKRFTARYMK